jgi:predicted transcriptional regulator
MTLKELAEKLQLEVKFGEVYMDREVTGGYTSDLLSDVMANAQEGNIWITIQTHQNIVAVASLLGLSAVVISGGSKPEASTLEKAVKGEVPILTTQWPSFVLSGKLFGLMDRE